MARSYYDSSYTGQQIDEAVKAGKEIADISKASNSGKIISFDANGKPIAVENPSENYTAGTGISISDSGVISCTVQATSYTAGAGISISDSGVISVNISSANGVSF